MIFGRTWQRNDVFGSRSMLLERARGQQRLFSQKILPALIGLWEGHQQCKISYNVARSCSVFTQSAHRSSQKCFAGFIYIVWIVRENALTYEFLRTTKKRFSYFEIFFEKVLWQVRQVKEVVEGSELWEKTGVTREKENSLSWNRFIRPGRKPLKVCQSRTTLSCTLYRYFSNVNEWPKIAAFTVNSRNALQ